VVSTQSTTRYGKLIFFFFFFFYITLVAVGGYIDSYKNTRPSKTNSYPALDDE
jgi:hypothetical protein